MENVGIVELRKQLLNDILEKYDAKYIINKLYIHRGTFNRWIQKNDIPVYYIGEFNKLLNDKYDISNFINEKTKDQFYTSKYIAEYCYNILLDFLKKFQIDESQYKFIEPSVGCGCFYNLLPIDRRLGIDIDPKIKDRNIINEDYLSYKPINKKNIVIGNPPFGLRGNLALRFINHSYKFADVVAFVLPKLFNSDGKGNAKDRVKGYKLAYSENLPLNSFEYPNGKKVSVATIFQIWTKVNVDKIKFIKRETCKSFIKIYSLSNGSTPSSIRNKNMLYKCDVYLPSTCFSKMGAYSNFDELPNKRGYGVVFLKNKNILKNIFYNKINWKKEAFLSTNSALNLRTSIIENALIKQGVID
ncbi:hypothetical protein [uncultured Brachyspira sp.]|uniref:hypothetical protein n=1 Tax=uncultured Brachyspira sp. TaxID=221953 RepID=UPI00258EDA39|nr:hypothetical protein [uncultured Brachyspira sp.]